MNTNADLTVRPATPHDAPTVRRLAALDSARVPREPVLLAELGGRAVAALSLTRGTTVADPFVRTEPVLDALRSYAA